MNTPAGDADFHLDARLAADTLIVTDLPLSRVLLMNDARFPWLILVPMRADRCEISDLDSAAQIQLWQEVNLAAQALRQVAPCDKINIAALGNIVQQLHVHVVARRTGDAAWPDPVWGQGHAQPYTANAMNERRQQLQDLLSMRP